MKMEFSTQRREMLLFLTTNVAAATHAQTSNFWKLCQTESRLRALLRM